MATPVTPPPDTDKRLLAFGANMEDKGSGIDIMHPDGSGLTNLTSELGAMIHSGRRMANTLLLGNDVDSLSPQIYVMDADGSNVVQLTKNDVYLQFEY